VARAACLRSSKAQYKLKEGYNILGVFDPGEGVCADPVDKGAILGRGGPDPHSGERERQLAPDKGSGKT
jgi:hypothetical protein